MASANTLKIMAEKRKLRAKQISVITPAGHGPNRAERRKALKTLRLRPKMGHEKQEAIKSWKKKAGVV